MSRFLWFTVYIFIVFLWSHFSLYFALQFLVARMSVKSCSCSWFIPSSPRSYEFWYNFKSI